MKRAMLLLMLLVALICAAPASASHTDPSGECDINLSPGTYSLEAYVNDDTAPGSTNIPHYKADATSPNRAVICLLSGTHTLTDSTTNFTATAVKLRQAKSQPTAPIVKGRLQFDEADNTVTDLVLDGFNTQGGQVTTGGGFTRQTTLPSPTLRATGLVFQYLDVSSQHLDGGASTGGGGICFNGTNNSTPAVSNVYVQFSRVHHCGDPYRTPALGQVESDPGARSDIHDHGLYANYAQNVTVTDNYIYSNVARGISFHYHGTGWYVARNIIDNNGHEGVHWAHNSPPAAIANDVTENLITNSGWSWNLGVGTESGLTNNFTGSDVTLNCLYDGNDGAPPDSSADPLNENIDTDLAGGGAYVPTSGADANQVFLTTGAVVPYGAAYDPVAGVFPLSATLPASCQDNKPFFGVGPRVNLAN